MLTTRLLHPDILDVLARNGHGAQVLIADGNYPFSTGAPPGARRVYLNLARDMLSVVDVLTVVKDHIPVEKALVMLPAEDVAPEIHNEFASILGTGVPFETARRFEFYDRARSMDTCLVIATGESRRFANILLTIGVVR